MPLRNKPPPQRNERTKGKLNIYIGIYINLIKGWKNVEIKAVLEKLYPLLTAIRDIIKENIYKEKDSIVFLWAEIALLPQGARSW